MVDNLDIDPKVPVLTGESLKDFKTYQRAVQATWLSLSEEEQKTSRTEIVSKSSWCQDKRVNFYRTAGPCTADRYGWPCEAVEGIGEWKVSENWFSGDAESVRDFL